MSGATFAIPHTAPQANVWTKVQLWKQLYRDKQMFTLTFTPMGKFCVPNWPAWLWRKQGGTLVQWLDLEAESSGFKPSGGPQTLRVEFGASTWLENFRQPFPIDQSTNIRSIKSETEIRRKRRGREEDYRSVGELSWLDSEVSLYLEVIYEVR